jgi:hypothetical protein
MIEVPSQFKPHQKFNYPSCNLLPFEEWYSAAFNSMNDVNDRLYLGIHFTAYFCNNNFANDLQKMRELQNYLNGLDVTKKYYTIIQYDDGLAGLNVSHLDIKIYAMSSSKDYPLPLISQPYEYDILEKKEIFANFVGRNTHKIRESIYQLSNKNGYYISQSKHNSEDYCRIIAKSTFTLCPRGYGANSFRIMEALQYNSIPVYISDTFVIPHNYNFEEYGVVIKEEDVTRIDEILKGFSQNAICEKQSKLKEVYRKYYTYQGTKDLILNDLRTC